MSVFLLVLKKSMQVDINIGRTGLGLCSMRSTLSELFAAPFACLRLASLVDKHRPVCIPQPHPINWNASPCRRAVIKRHLRKVFG